MRGDYCRGSVVRGDYCRGSVVRVIIAGVVL